MTEGEYVEWLELLKKDKHLGAKPTDLYGSYDKETEAYTALQCFDDALRLFINERVVDIDGDTAAAFTSMVGHYVRDALGFGNHAELGEKMMNRAQRIDTLFGVECSCEHCKATAVTLDAKGADLNFRVRVEDQEILIKLEHVVALASIFYRITYNLTDQVISGSSGLFSQLFGVTPVNPEKL